MWIITQLGKMVNADRLQTIEPDSSDPTKVNGYFSKDNAYMLGKYQNSEYAKAVIRHIGGEYRSNTQLMQMPMKWPLDEEK